MTKRLHTTYPESDDYQAHPLPDGLPERSASAIGRSLAQVARDVAGINIGVRREMLPCGDVNISTFVVTLPAGLPDGQRAELDYWLREVCGNLRYAGE